MNPRQRMAVTLVDPRTGKQYSVAMEQSLQFFEPEDIPAAIGCLLDMLKGQQQIPEVVRLLLHEEALRRAGGVQVEAAKLLGISPRMFHHWKRRLLENNPLNGKEDD